MSAGANCKFHGLFGSFAEITAQVRAGTQYPPEVGDTARFRLADGTLGECSFGASGWRIDRQVTPSGDVQFGGAVSADAFTGAFNQPVRAHLPRRVRIVNFGYSIDNSVSSSGQDVESITATIPGGTTSSTVQFDGTKAGILFRSKKVHFVGNCGISGQNVVQMLGRSAIAASTTRKAIYDALALRPDLIVMQGPLVNDGQTWTESTTRANVDVSVNLAKTLILQLSRGCPHVAFSGCLGISLPAWTEAKRAYVASLMVYAVGQLRDWAANVPGVHFIDPEGRLSVGQIFIAGKSSDGIHPSAAGGGTYATMLNELIEQLWDVTIPDPMVYDWNIDWSGTGAVRPTGVGNPATYGGAVAVGSVSGDGVWNYSFTTIDDQGGVYFELSTLETALASAALETGDMLYTEWDIQLTDTATGEPIPDWRIDTFLRLYNAANEAGTVIVTQSATVVESDTAGFCTPVIKLDRDSSALGTLSGTRTSVTPLRAGAFTIKVTAPKLRKYVSALAT